jgi:pimeloyl-ACP methyl ester carboxylesterase
MAVKSIQYKQRTIDISYEIVNPQEKVDLIVLHGWGSNKNLMKQSFSPYMKGFRHIYIDLPGFGKSTACISMTTADVTRIVEMFMVLINASKDVVMGHSFGGKVALLLDPKVLVLVSSAGIYVEKPFSVKLKIALTKLANLLGIRKLSSLFRAADAKELNEPMYQTFKNVVNEDFSEEFSKYQGKALLCWGDQDTATPLSSGEKISVLIKDSMLKIYKGDHYFFMNHAEHISKQVEATFLSTLGKE